MAIKFWSRLAEDAPVPVYCLFGDGGKSRFQSLRLDGRLRLVPSPRHATVLLVAGEIPKPLHEHAARIHDQLPAPRDVFVWNDVLVKPFENVAHADLAEDPVPRIIELHRALARRARPSSRLLGPTDNPVDWKGVGPHGQGGEGMMGGNPYGRPMAMTGNDLRDGLQLDRVSLEIGPFLPWLPTGLRLKCELQGDVIQSVQFEAAPLRHLELADAFVRARTEEVTLAAIEMARAKHHLEATADLLFLLGVDALARRALDLSINLSPTSLDRVKAFERVLRRNVSLKFTTRGLGKLKSDKLAGAGPVARAAGREEDARMDDPAYQAVGFKPLCSAGNDTEARWKQRLREAVQSLELAQAGADRFRLPSVPLEGPRGVIGVEKRPVWVRALPDMLSGMAWDEFVTTLVSLDLDPAAFPVMETESPGEKEEEEGE